MTLVVETPAVDRIVTGTLRANCYVVSGSSGEALVVDPGDDADSIGKHLTARELRPIAVLITHAHDDHLAAAAWLADSKGASIHMHSGDAAVLRRMNAYRVLGSRAEEPIPVPSPDVDLAGVAALRIGGWQVNVLHTPGHTPGSVCFEIGGQLFTGDTLFADRIGRTDLPEGDRSGLMPSLERIADRYPASTPIRPGHGEPASLGEALRRAGIRAELR